MKRKKESVIGTFRKNQSEERENPKEKKKYRKKMKDNFVVGVVFGLHRLFFLSIMFEKTEYNTVISLIRMV